MEEQQSDCNSQPSVRKVVPGDLPVSVRQFCEAMANGNHHLTQSQSTKDKDQSCTTTMISSPSKAWILTTTTTTFAFVALTAFIVVGRARRVQSSSWVSRPRRPSRLVTTNPRSSGQPTAPLSSPTPVAATSSLSLLYTRFFSTSSSSSDQQSQQQPSEHAGMPKLPRNVVKYSQVPSKPGVHFTSTTIPKGLLKDHSTKQGTWGVIRVVQGSLMYHIQEPKTQSFRLVTPTTGIIEPTCKHRVEPLTDDVQFVVEFYRIPNSGPVDEPREGL